MHEINVTNSDFTEENLKDMTPAEQAKIEAGVFLVAAAQSLSETEPMYAAALRVQAETLFDPIRIKKKALRDEFEAKIKPGVDGLAEEIEKMSQ